MTNMTFVRWQRDESRRCRVFDAPGLGHGAYDSLCVICETPLGVGNMQVQLIAIAPQEDDDEAWDKYEAGRWFNCEAAIVHMPCVGVLDDAELEKIIMELRVVEVDA